MMAEESKQASALAEDQKEKELDDLLQQGEEMAAQREDEKVVHHLIQLIQRFPDSPLPHHNLAVVYLTMLRDEYSHLSVWEDLAEDESLFELAVAEEEAALEIDSEFLPARNNLGTLFALRGWWRNAIEQWEQSLSISPEQPQVRGDLAQAYARIR